MPSTQLRTTFPNHKLGQRAEEKNAILGAKKHTPPLIEVWTIEMDLRKTRSKLGNGFPTGKQPKSLVANRVGNPIKTSYKFIGL